MTPEEIEKLRENYRSALQEIELLNEESREQVAEITRLRRFLADELSVEARKLGLYGDEE